jgi:predicted aldo/keto reductase-like oxidoreductase
VNTILRYNYYYQNKRDEKGAMKLYANLPGKKAEICLECPAYCEDACPNGVSARSLMTMAHQNLTMDLDSFA